MKDYAVKSIDSFECKDWLLNKHYAKRLCSISYSFGLFNKDNILQGVITFGMPPSSTLAESICGKGLSNHVLELNRLVVNDNLPQNCLSFFVSKSIKKLPDNKIIVSFADANMNHNGYIYQATNFIYTGVSSNTSKLIDKDGNEFHFRNIGHYQKKLFSNFNLKKRIIDNLCDELLKDEYKKIQNRNKFTGHCYVASECYYHLSSEKLKVFHIKHEGSTHWFLKDEKDNIIDLTKEQFKTNVPYNLGRNGFFLTKEPSKRCKQLINKVLSTNFKIVKRRKNEESIDRISIAEYLKKNKGQWTAKKIDLHFKYKDTASHWFRTDNGFSFPNVNDWIELKKLLKFDNTYDKVMTDYEWKPCPQDIIKKLKLKKVDIKPKHRYIYIKGTKGFKKKCMHNFKLQIKHYPKGDNKRYDASYKPVTQTKLF